MPKNRVSASTLLALALVGLQAGTGSAQGQVDCSVGIGGHLRFPSVAPPGPGGPQDPCDVPGFRSHCWQRYWNSPEVDGTLSSGESIGFALNLDLWQAVSSGTFPPRTLDRVNSSLALLSPEVRNDPHPTAFGTRPVLDESLDLITGEPLLQSIDFELPFGGATFRHVRTHSRRSEINRPSSAFTPSAAGEFWDWQGYGWMMSENPIFLFDAGWGDVMGTDGAEKARCYFIPDAHHAIPFERLPDSGQYAAPAQFDATLRRLDGAWDDLNSEWSTLPTTFELWLDHNSVKYTIELAATNTGTGIQYDDMHHILEGASAVSAHLPPTTEKRYRLGLPHYGLVTKIEDRQGHRVLLRYGHTQRQVANDVPGTEDCFECKSNCNEKGQLRYALLQSRSSSDPDAYETLWTVVYTYRAFFGTSGVEPLEPDPRYAPSELIEADEGLVDHALHSIHAYRGILPGFPEEPDDEDPGWANSTLPAEMFLRFPHTNGDPYHMYGSVDDVEAIDIVEPGNDPRIPATALLPTHWEYEARYLYSEVWTIPLYRDYDAPEIGNNPHHILNDFEVCREINPSFSGPQVPLLIKATVHRRASVSTASPTSKTDTVYRYKSIQSRPYLAEVFEPREVGRLASVATYNAGQGTETLTANDLFKQQTSLWLTIPQSGGPSVGGRMGDFTTYQFGRESRADFNETALCEDMVQHFICAAGDPAQTAGSRLLELSSAARGGVTSFETGGRSGASTRHYELYRFLVMPEAPAGGLDNDKYCHILQLSEGPGSGNYPLSPQRSIFHQPFRWFGFRNSGGTWIEGTPPDLSQPRWVTVIDWTETDLPSQNQTPSSPEPAKMRRVVQMNAAGYVLHDALWAMQFEDGDYTPVSASGVIEHFLYEDTNHTFGGFHLPGRLLERRTVGWSATPQGDQGSTGLIYQYAYHDTVVDSAHVNFAKYVGASGVKKGTDGTVQWLNQYVRHPDRPEIITHSISFVRPTNTLLSFTSPPSYSTDETRPYHLTLTRLDLDTAFGVLHPTAPRSEWPVKAKLMVAPPIRVEPSATLCYPVTKEFFDDKGRSVWQGSGLLADPLQAASDGGFDRFFVNFTKYDDNGQVVATAVDTTAGHALRSSVPNDSTNKNFGSVPSTYPTSADASQPTIAIRRVPASSSGSPALHYETNAWYDSYGPYREMFPNGLNRITKYRSLSDDTVEMAVYDALRIGASNNQWEPLAAGTLTNLPGLAAAVQVSKQRIVAWDQVITIDPAGNQFVEASQTLSTLKPDYDQSGRPTSIKSLNGDGSGDQSAAVQVQAQYGNFGEVSRRVDPDGTITRMVTDERGFPVRTYRGTLDHHVYWGTDDPHAPQPDDNLLLIDKTVYGTGSKDAHKPIVVRRYRTKLDEQYGERPAAEAEEDSRGFREVHRYDWRMRDVVTERFSEDTESQTGSLLRATAIHRDHADRVVFVAEYGASGVPSGVDPSLLTDSLYSGTQATFFSLQQILASSPLSLTHTLYNAAGQAVETREYSVSDTSGNSYLMSRSYTDHGGRTTYSQSPNGVLRRMVYDALGREVQSSRWSGSEEIERTTTTYDADGNAIAVETLERPHNITGSLSLSNAIRTRTFNWFDATGRLVATADLGARGANNTFTPNSSDTLERTRTGGVDSPLCPIVDVDGIPEFVPSVYGNSGAPLNGSLVRGYIYDGAGRKIAEIDPHGMATVYTYDGLGNMVEKRENAQASTSSSHRITNYKYENGNLVAIAAAFEGSGIGAFAWHSNTLPHQITDVFYGADVVDAVTFDVVSRNNQWIGGVHFPAEDESWTWPPSANLSFKYYANGQIAERTDARGVKLRYRYDALDRLASTEVYQGASWISGGGPATDSINWISYQYDVLGRTTLVTARTGGSSGTIVAETQYAYDSRGNLLKDAQSYGQAATSGTPKTDYSWSYSAATSGNYDRLNQMTYPAQIGPPARRLLQMQYGGTNTRDDKLSRIASIKDATSSAITVAAYSYSGESRVVQTTLGGGRIRQFYDDGTNAGYTRLDGHGRPKVLKFEKVPTSGSITTIHQYDYVYDAGGNRIAAKVKQQDYSGQSRNDTRSSRFGYDELARLVSAQVGTFNADILTQADPALSSLTNAGGIPQTTTWSLDVLGNWSGTGTFGGNAVEGKTIRGYIGASNAFDTIKSKHTTGEFNELDQVATTIASGGTTTTGYVNDLTGSLRSDGQFLYQYDAFGRLLRINEKGTLTFNDDGSVLSGTIGNWVVHYTYDGIGRLICKQQPYPAPGGTELHIERYFYDGIRRIQEVHTNPLQIIEEDGPAAMAAIASAEGEGGGGENQLNPPEIANYTWLEREYVYGPGDTHGVDEFIAQLDNSGNYHYIMQDPSTDVVGYTNSTGTIEAQYTWDAYGLPIGVDNFSGALNSSVGHHGLFFDRLDVGVMDALGTTESLRLASGARGVYQVRNRVLSPGLGRWLQRDPNATGQPIIGSVAFYGRTDRPVVARAILQRHYGDGLNILAYVLANPLGGTDVLGLDGTGTVAGQAVNAAVMGVLATVGVIGGGALLHNLMHRGPVALDSISLNVPGALANGFRSRWIADDIESWDGLVFVSPGEQLLDAELGVYSSSNADPEEGYAEPEEAVPWEQAAKDGEVTLKQTGETHTKNQDVMRAKGYTRKCFFKDGNGNTWSIFKKPSNPPRYRGAKPSSEPE